MWIHVCNVNWFACAIDRLRAKRCVLEITYRTLFITHENVDAVSMPLDACKTLMKERGGKRNKQTEHKYCHSKQSNQLHGAMERD